MLYFDVIKTSTDVKHKSDFTQILEFRSFIDENINAVFLPSKHCFSCDSRLLHLARAKMKANDELCVALMKQKK